VISVVRVIESTKPVDHIAAALQAGTNAKQTRFIWVNRVIGVIRVIRVVSVIRFIRVIRVIKVIRVIRVIRIY
jgi:hypothetical protein